MPETRPAARAGEAGAGFAVVAEEVRNLAQRSAQAARDTAVMIETAVSSTEEGVAISEKVQHNLVQIVEKVRGVDELMAEVATAAAQESNGITQLNSAVAEMDQITQGNAAHAEESAGAATELNLQTEAMRKAVEELRAVVEGRILKTASHPRVTVGSRAVGNTTAKPRHAPSAARLQRNGKRPVQGDELAEDGLENGEAPALGADSA